MSLYVVAGEILAKTGPAVSVIAIAASVVGSLIASRLSRQDRFPTSSPETQDLRELARIAEIVAALRRHERIAKWSGRADGLLIFGQVVIGGVLASSIVQNELSKPTIGLLGLMVLVASLVHKQFRPDLNSAAARRRAVLDRQLLRETEDAILFIQQREMGVPNAEVVETLRRHVTSRLFEIEMAEAQEERSSDRSNVPSANNSASRRKPRDITIHRTPGSE